MDLRDEPRFEVFVDRGGTFTDCVLRDRTLGDVRATKVLSTDDAPVVGIRSLLGLDDDAPIPPCDVRIGTTLATNALLERTGADVALVVTRGFRDLLHISDQARPSLFSLDTRRPRPLTDRVIEVDGRLDASGRPLDALDEAALERDLGRLRDEGLSSLAVALLHAHANGDVEKRVGAIARALGFVHVALSHEVVPERGLLARADTTVADAYLGPVLSRYVAYLGEALPGSRLRFVQSSGGLCTASRFRGRDAALSGPAGGVVATLDVARQAGIGRAIGFDMGGTSTDVCRVEGELEPEYGGVVAGVRIRAPMLAIHTVAAGGGSICRVDGGRLVVGPESAGAHPGPLCYGHPEARELALTDVAVLLGRVLPDHFPFRLDPSRAATMLRAKRDELLAAGLDRDPLEIAEGFLTVAVERMAAAIREVSIAKGHDPRDHAMVVFGGAGGQYAGLVARRLGIRRLVFHPLAGVLSAYGIGVSRTSWHGEADAGLRRLDATAEDAFEPVFAALERRGREALAADGVPEDATATRRRIDLRHPGSEAILTVESGVEAGVRRAFDEAHARLFGYVRPSHPIEAVTLRVEVSEREPPRVPSPVPSVVEERGETELVLEGKRVRVPRLHRDSLAPGEALVGPAVLVEPSSTIVVEPGFRAERREDGLLVLVDEGAPHRETASTEVDPVRLEVMNHLFMSIAEQMGAVLRRTAHSTNIRDRLDFSCAVFDAEGNLVANAPHIPVHLGAMGESVRAVKRAHPRAEPGDAFVTNDPSSGGSHLPDVTVVSPVHDAGGTLRYWVANRGHHADVGGVTPGSMPAFSRTLDDEGVVFRALPVVRGGRFDEAAFRAALAGTSHPARRPDENVADLEAQLAANRTGVRQLEELAARMGPEVVTAYMEHVQASAAESVRAALRPLAGGTRRFEDAMDDGTPVVVTLTIGDGSLIVDFEGTGPASEGNLNAPRAVTTSAVLYVLRTLVGRGIPLNSGCLRPVTIRIPPGSLLDPPEGAAVAAGNVETSQRVVDVLLGALGLSAASQGTMNNVAFGDATFGYYETLGGGAGATEATDGGSAVHVHMTNSRLTDAEVLEARFPVRLRSFGVRRGSGGEGRHRGGDGLVREYEFLRPVTVSVVSERRVRSPWGLEGGGEAARGANLVDGEPRPSRFEEQLAAGARLRIETPGGGGYGRA
ncbi:MAG: hydantoinase B/oxoprolinase family protein [Polyangiales bacterium]